MISPEALQLLCLTVLREAGRGRVRRRLEVLVNTDVLGVEGARRVYVAAFGGDLKAVPDKLAQSSGGR